MPRNQKTGHGRFDTKRCPECGVDLPLDCRKCPACNIKVGGVDPYGRARSPIDWKAYAVCVLAWLVFAFFVWWGFFHS